MPSPLTAILTFLTGLYYIGGFLLSLWWIYIPLILIFLAKGLWLKKVRQKFIKEIDWVLLEVRPPREIQKIPRAMEQFFAGLHGTQTTPCWWDRNIYGAFQYWFSLEIVSQSGEIHFFIRTVSKYRDLVESHIYAQYPDAEITQADDYVHLFPSDIPNKDYDVYGTELILEKDDVYPIRTYPSFEKDILLEEQRVDPIAALLETMSKLNEGEHIWIQTLIRPVGDDWKKAGEKLIDKLLNRAIKRAPGELRKEARAWKDTSKEQINLLIAGPIIREKGEERAINPLDWMTKSEKDVLTAIEENISKIAFETIIRFVYVARRDIFRKTPIRNSIIGCYKQFNTQHLNGFRRNPKVDPRLDYRIELSPQRNRYRKRKVLADYKKRNFIQHSKAIFYLKPFFFERLPIINWFFIRSQPFIFNVEELATVYHYPALTVKAPLVPKVEALKGEPPIGLPLE